MIANIFELDALLVGFAAGALAFTVFKPVLKNLVNMVLRRTN